MSARSLGQKRLRHGQRLRHLQLAKAFAYGAERREVWLVRGAENGEEVEEGAKKGGS